MAQEHEIHSIDESFDFDADLKRKTLLAIVIGIALVIVGAFIVHMGWNITKFVPTEHHDVAERSIDPALNALNHSATEASHGAAHGHEGAGHHEKTVINRIVANLWMNSVYFLGIAVGALFFMSYNYVAKAGWYTSFKRVPEAIPSFMVVPSVILLILFLVPDTRHMIFHWTQDGIMDPSAPNYDKIIAGKSWYLNNGFFIARMIAYFAVWYFLWIQIRKNSLLEDQSNDLSYYKASRKYAKMFLIFFAVTSSTAAWDFSMSIDVHWFSTMFGWYHLASWHVAALATIMLTIIFLKERGYLKEVNHSSIHDLGKLLFGFSIFWTYVWFSQYLLIFYANLPEETIYFRERFTGYGGRFYAPFHISLLLNFFFPFLILMARGSKRNLLLLKLASWSILVGHWFDFYQMQMPGVAGDSADIGLIEWGTTLAFVGILVYFVFTQLAKVGLYAKNHPFIEESMHHNI